MWIEKGYEHFGLYGPDKLGIKLIAEECGIARTSFNYYFSNKEEFFSELIDKHYDLLNQYCDAGKLHCKKYLPDLHQLALSFPTGIKFQKQLFSHRHIVKYNEVYNECNEISGREFILRLFIDYYELPLSIAEAAQLHESLTDAWYSRLDVDQMTLKKLVRSSEEIMKGLLVLMANNRNRASLPPISIPAFLELTHLSKN